MRASPRSPSRTEPRSWTTARRASAQRRRAGSPAPSRPPRPSRSTRRRTWGRTGTEAPWRPTTPRSRAASSACASTAGAGATSPRSRAGTHEWTRSRRPSCAPRCPSWRRTTRAAGRSRRSTTRSSRSFRSSAGGRPGRSPRHTCTPSARRRATRSRGTRGAGSRPPSTTPAASPPAGVPFSEGGGAISGVREACETSSRSPSIPMSDEQVEPDSGLRDFFERRR